MTMSFYQAHYNCVICELEYMMDIKCATTVISVQYKQYYPKLFLHFKSILFHFTKITTAIVCWIFDKVLLKCRWPALIAVLDASCVDTEVTAKVLLPLLHLTPFVTMSFWWWGWWSQWDKLPVLYFVYILCLTYVWHK